jgi:predicted small lipoprotein YifL
LPYNFTRGLALSIHHFFAVIISTLLFTLYACGGGGGVATPAAVTAAPAAQTGVLTTTTNSVATGDTINGLPITNATAIAKLAAALTAVPSATAQIDATTYPIAGKQFFRNFVGMAGSDATLNSLNSTTSSAKTVIIIGEFQSFTAARVFPCTFNPTDYNSSRGDCNVVNIAPGPYPAQSSGGSKCREIEYQSGIIQQCIKD